MMNQRVVGCVLAVLSLSFLGCGMLDRNGVEREVDVVVGEKLREEGLNEQLLVLVSGDIRGDTAIKQVEDIFMMELLRKGYRVADRSVQDEDWEGALSDHATLDMAVRVSGSQISGWTGRIIDQQTRDLLLMLRLGRGDGVRVSEASISDGALGGSRGITLSPQTESVMIDEVRMIIEEMPHPGRVD